MGTIITQAGGWFAAYEDGGGAFDDGVWWADAGNHITQAGGGHVAYEYGGAAWWHDGSADVGDNAGYHGADVHISDSGRWGHKLFPFRANMSISE